MSSEIKYTVTVTVDGCDVIACTLCDVGTLIEFIKGIDREVQNKQSRLALLKCARKAMAEDSYPRDRRAPS